MNGLNKSQWNEKLKKYAQPSLKKSVFQIMNSVIPYMGLLVLMYMTMRYEVHYIFTLGLAFIASGFLVRIFILFHDCTHLSFFKSKTACSIWGHIFGILSFTPYHTWQLEHNIHHGTVGNLDRRGIGDIWTMTVSEYENSGFFKKLWYRLYRNPLFLFLVAPFALFAVLNRIPSVHARRKDHLSYLVTNVGIVAVFILVWKTLGLKYYLAIQLPILYFASIMGVWLFFVQHQFEEVYWSSDSEWDIVKAALKGSSFYQLPLVFEWFSGYIGYHNIHHLNSRIPNYNLKTCYKDVHDLLEEKKITFFESFKLAFLELYDEKSKKMISFRTARKLRHSRS